MFRVSAPPNPQTPGQADPLLRPRTKVGQGRFKAWRRRLSRLGAFIWEKWWRVFWAILFWLGLPEVVDHPGSSAAGGTA